jgi:L-threonylcarbamoyladenylate synthase
LKTELLRAVAESGKLCRASISRAVELLRAGELVAFPTDTVYGVGAIAIQSDAVARLYVAKGRSREKAIPILVANVADLGTVAYETSSVAQILIDHFWPGALTLILPKRDTVPHEVSPSAGVAVRLPDLNLPREIIAAAACPLAVTSANRSGQPSSHTAIEVMSQLGGRIAAVLDGGSCPGGVPSTVLDCTSDPPRVLRVGAISIESLQKVTRVG